MEKSEDDISKVADQMVENSTESMRSLGFYESKEVEKQQADRHNAWKQFGNDALDVLSTIIPFIGQLREGSESVGNIASNFNDISSNVMDFVEDTGGYLGEKSDEFIESYTGFWKKILNIQPTTVDNSAALKKNVKNYVDPIEDTYSVMEDEFNGFLHLSQADPFLNVLEVLTRFNPQLHTAVSGIKDLSSEYEEWLHDTDRLDQQYENLIRNAFEAMNADDFDITNPVYDALLDMVVKSINDGSLFELGAKGIGEQLVAGTEDGVESSSRQATTVIELLIARMINAARSEAKIHSPSREFAEIGMYMCKGLAVGIRESASEARNAVLSLADMVLAAVQDLEEADYNPVIRPVLDLSGVQAGMQTMNGMFNNPYGLTMPGQTLTIDPSIAQLYSNMAVQKDYTADIRDIRSEIGELRGDLRIMSDSVRQMKFVFNTGAVVAAIGPEMDQYLGQQGYYAVRGEIP